MKTLDEVIELSERCTLPYPGDCLNCEYFEDETGYDCRCKIIADALHYLRQYQKLVCLEEGESAEIVKYTVVTKPNEPLSWDELKQMEGKPVFVEERYRNGDLKSSGWWLIDFWNDDQICLRDQGGNPWNDHRSNYGRDWMAYRKERE